MGLRFAVRLPPEQVPGKRASQAQQQRTEEVPKAAGAASEKDQHSLQRQVHMPDCLGGVGLSFTYTRPTALDMLLSRNVDADT